MLRAQETPASKRVAVGCIGVGGRGFIDMMNVSKDNEIVAICDVDANHLAKAAAKFPNARQYKDFRELLVKESALDGVIVSTPDHSHYPAAMHAISLGKHVCVQKTACEHALGSEPTPSGSKQKGHHHADGQPWPHL